MPREKKELDVAHVASFEKNNQQVYVDAIPIEIGGENRIYCGVREYYKKEDKWLPSFKGVTFLMEHVPSLISAVTSTLEVDPYPEDELILAIPKNSNEEIHVSLKQYKGKEYMDLRKFFKTKDGNWGPTKEGVTVPPDCVDELIRCLEKFNEGYCDGRQRMTEDVSIIKQ